MGAQWPRTHKWSVMLDAPCGRRAARGIFLLGPMGRNDLETGSPYNELSLRRRVP